MELVVENGTRTVKINMRGNSRRRLHLAEQLALRIIAELAKEECEPEKEKQSFGYSISSDHERSIEPVEYDFEEE